jgi:hypothetical protein
MASLSEELVSYSIIRLQRRGHGTDKAILGGIMGLRVDDPRIKQSYDIAAQEGVDVAYAQISRDKNTRGAMAIMKLDQPCPDDLADYFRLNTSVTDVVTINKLGNEYERTEED